MPAGNKIARWVVENDPSWEKTVDSNLAVLRWTKKGTGLQAVASPTSLFCEIIGGGGEDETQGQPTATLTNPLGARPTQASSASSNIASDITKYLSSRYLNPRVGEPSNFSRKRKF